MKSVILFRQIKVTELWRYIGVVIMLPPLTLAALLLTLMMRQANGLSQIFFFLAFLQLVTNCIRSTFGYELHRLSRPF